MDPALQPARSLTLVSIDFETTGKVGRLPSEPWQVGLVVLRNGRVEDGTRFQSLIRVGDRPFHPAAPGAHHRLRREIALAPPWEGFRPVFKQRCAGLPLVAHNVPTERGLLRRLSPLEPWGPWIDTLTLVRHAYASLPSHELGAVVASLGLLPRILELIPAWQPHDALSDAFSAAVVLEHLLALPAWRDVPLAQLTTLRAGSRVPRSCPRFSLDPGHPPGL